MSRSVGARRAAEARAGVWRVAGRGTNDEGARRRRGAREPSGEHA
jgi:hypothetical protein